MLTNSQYEKINRIYDARRTNARRLKEDRLKEVNEKLPVIAEINEKLVEGSIRAARLAFAGNEESIDNLKKSNEYLIEQKKTLMRNAGFPDDYLEDVYECAVCKDTGRTDAGKCTCYYRTVIDTFYMDEDRRALLKREDFSNFNTDLYDDQIVDERTGKTDREIVEDSLTSALDFTEEFKERYENLLISGNSGTGKTFLANCIANALIRQDVLVLYMPAFEFFKVHERARFLSGEDKADASEELEFIYGAECLIIDDLGAEVSNSFVNAQLFECIEKRALKKRPTVITTNLSKEKLGERYSERIRSRLISEYNYLKMPGEDNRRTGKINKN